MFGNGFLYCKSLKGSKVYVCASVVNSLHKFYLNGYN